MSSTARVYNAVFTPESDGAITISVGTSSFQDIASNVNSAVTSFAFTLDRTAPTMTITSTDVVNGGLTNKESINVTFTPSEVITGFANEDITVGNGSLSTLSKVANKYTGVFTPASNGSCTIDVTTGSFRDSASNVNSAATTQFYFYKNTPVVE